MNNAIDEVLRHPLPDAPKKLAFSILRIPFFLEPQYPEDLAVVETNRERLIKKWGGQAGWDRQKDMHDLKGRGLEAGIPFFNLDRKASNTMASHRLIQYLGKTYGLAVSEAVYDELNKYYFVDGHSLNDRPRLARVACELLVQVRTLCMVRHRLTTSSCKSHQQRSCNMVVLRLRHTYKLSSAMLLLWWFAT